MDYLINIIIILIAIEHCGFLYLEMFLWTRKSGRKIFSLSDEHAKITKVLAANQGLYNGFLCLGLIWGLAHPDAAFGRQLNLFFLCCIIIAGIYGGITVKRTIFYIQALPAIIACILILIN
ncbi:MAG: DUF1304 domain-containing protein [Gammaproteobacteria bacterium]|nr:DUF1304 domain-containing protein [Gammaproteobacteria bacterium]